jgi:hypothetical protein
MAYLPSMAFVNMPLVFTRPNSEYQARAVMLTTCSLLDVLNFDEAEEE